MWKRMLFGCMALCVSAMAVAQQDTVLLTLDDCIRTALDRNISLKRARNAQLIAEADRFQAIMNFFPTVSASVNYDYFFGNFFDTNAARQVSETSNSSNPNVASNLVLFNGFANHYNVQRTRNALMGAQADVAATEQTVQANVMQFYLQVILDRETAQIEKERVDLLQTQLDRENKRLSVGVGNLQSVYNLQAQLANQKLTYNNAQVRYRRDHLALLQAMQLDVSGAVYEIAPVNISEDSLLLEVAPFSDVLDEIVAENPSLRSSRHNFEMARYNLRMTRADRLPRLSVLGAVGSNYSSNGARNPSTGDFEPEANLAEQLRYNEFEYVNFTLNIPIFTRFATQNSIQKAKIAVANAELSVMQAVNDLTNTVQTAYLDLVTAQSTYESALENLESASQSFEFMKKRVEAGNADFYTFMESMNTYNRARLELVNAKYSIVFRQKILELYRTGE